MRKIAWLIIGSALLSINTFANSNLYKNFKAGEEISKYMSSNDLKNNEISCDTIALPLSTISKCYTISEKESLAGIKDFELIISTINNKINSIHLFKNENDSSLSRNIIFWNTLFESGLKGYSSYNLIENLPMKVILSNKIDFINKQYSNYEIAYNSKNSFTMASVLIETTLKIGEEFDLIKVLSTEPKKLIRTIEILDDYDAETAKWSYRIDIVNLNIQNNLQQEYNKLNNIKPEKI